MSFYTLTDNTHVTLHQYQVSGVEFLKARRAALLADDPGLGKTYQVLAAATELHLENILVICPASVVAMWRIQLTAWGYNKSDVYSYASLHKIPKNPVSHRHVPLPTKA